MNIGRGRTRTNADELLMRATQYVSHKAAESLGEVSVICSLLYIVLIVGALN
jgi:hypothetical protein